MGKIRENKFAEPGFAESGLGKASLGEAGLAEPSFAEEYRKILADVFEDIVRHRWNLHEIPELGNEEFKTSAYLESVFTALGIKYEKHDTAIIGFIDAGSKTSIAFRTDMDGLPVAEQTGLERQSKHQGKMHACGHDGHMAMLLGMAHILGSGSYGLNKNIVFICQPAEENPGGAEPLVKTGFLGKYNVEEVFGIHLHPDIQQGYISTVPGPMMAMVSDLNIKIEGISAHGAMPHLGRDALLAAGQMVTQLQQIVSREIDPVSSAVVSVGTINGGEARNIICKDIYMEGTIRTFSEETSAYVNNRIQEIAEGVSKSCGVKVTAETDERYPPVINDQRLTEEFFKINPNSLPLVPQMISEDFSYYQKERPGLFFFVGTRNEDRGFIHGLHSASFQYEDESLLYGIQAYLRLLHSRGYIEI